MNAALSSSTLTLALVGNPNTGKSTLFNALCGLRQRVGNYPGVTVEKKVGRTTIGDRVFDVVDLPGSYSLSPRSPDEMIVVDVLLGRRSDVPSPDVVVCIVDASNLERNLYLVSQVLEMGRPTILALNMMDVAEEKGIAIDAARLEEQLGLPVVPLQAHRKQGLDRLKEAIASVVEKPAPKIPSPLPEAIQREVTALEAFQGNGQPPVPRYLIERLLLDSSGYLRRARLEGVTPELLDEVDASRKRLVDAGIAIPGVEAVARYEWASRITETAVRHAGRPANIWTDRIDRLLTHKIWGLAIFALVMMTMFQAVFFIAEPASLAIDWLNGTASQWAARWIPAGAVQSLLVNGVIEGVGSVLSFLPQILLLFLFIAILEDCGYMARAAYLMDKFMCQVGLSGKSFIPLLSSFACAVPGIMATRVIENRRDRLVTILVAPLMTCSARLPVYTLLIQAFIPNRPLLGPVLGLRGFVLFALYALGIVVAIAVAWLLRKTLVRGALSPFIMELPSYQWPGPAVVVHRMVERGWDFVYRAGTLILAVTILVWAIAYYPHDLSAIDPLLTSERAQLEQQLAALTPSDPNEATSRESLSEQLDQVDARIQGALLQQSYLGRLGRFIEPAVRPLGWDWRIGCAVIASFPAREVVIATMAVIYNMGDADDPSAALHETLQQATWDDTGRPVFSIPVALSLMVFYALCAQCVSTLVVIRQETNSWRWPAFTFVYMTGLAYVGAWLTYVVGMAVIG